LSRQAHSLRDLGTKKRLPSPPSRVEIERRAAGRSRCVVGEYNYHRPHQGRCCFGKTPIQTFLDALPLAKEKLMAA
jgi:hypothetical protein